MEESRLMTLVKICGIQRPEDAAAATVAGADLLGFIFAPSRRQVDARTVKRIASGLGFSNRPKLVGVFVDTEAEEINRVADEAGLDLIQLHGDEAAEILPKLSRPVIRSVTIAPTASFDVVANSLDAYIGGPNQPRYFLVDGYHPDQRGGSGIVANWEIAQLLAEQFPVILAGGLLPDNVEAAIKAVRPLGVDVSSGVESDGAKDPLKIETFTERARTAFALRMAASS
jgi:phosphoribosylanthranilate isomerase